jgi:hypothetical protein
MPLLRVGLNPPPTARLAVEHSQGQAQYLFGGQFGRPDQTWQGLSPTALNNQPGRSQPNAKQKEEKNGSAMWHCLRQAVERSAA